MSGDNRKGQLGILGLQNVVYPTMLTSLSHKHITDVACGDEHTLIITSGQQVFTCGDNSEG
jgi:alpha-tubulin suppressor-like RCC1 family protein